MNLFQNTALVQALRDEYELSIPQAQVILLAHQHRTVSTQTVRHALALNTHNLSGSEAISKPVRKKLLKAIDRVRSPSTNKLSTVYALADEIAVTRVISAAADKNVEMFLWINREESQLQNEILEAESEGE